MTNTRPLCFTEERWNEIEPDVQARILIEYRIVSCLVRELLTHGFSLSLHDGEIFVIHHVTDHDQFMQAIMSVDEERVYVTNNHEPNPNRPRIGSVFLVYGNDGWDVINDYSSVIEDHIPETLALVDSLGG